MTLPTEDVAALVADLQNVLTDWNGADIPDAELPRVDVLCGTLRLAATALSTLAGERDEAWDIIEKERGTVAMLSADAGAWHRRATTAEAKVVAMRELVGGAQGILMNCDVETGICCCGDAMENHGNPMDCGHSPVDHGSYSAQQWLEAANAALASADQPARTALLAGTPPSGAETQESAREALSRQEGGR